MKHLILPFILTFILLATSCNTKNNKNEETLVEEYTAPKYIDVDFSLFENIQLGDDLEKVKIYMPKFTKFTLVDETEGNMNYEMQDANGAKHFVSFGSFGFEKLEYISYKIDVKETHLEHLVFDYMYQLEKHFEKVYSFDFETTWNEDGTFKREWFLEEQYINVSSGINFVYITVDYNYGP